MSCGFAAAPSSSIRAGLWWLPPLRINGRLHVGSVLPSPDDVDDVHTDFGAIDEMAVERRLAGDRVPITKAERVEVVRRARKAGWSFLDIEHRAGVPKPERYIIREQAAS